MNNKFLLTETELNDFHKNGFVGPFKLYEEDEMKNRFNQLRIDLLDTNSSAYNIDDYTGVTNISNYDRHLDIDFLSDHICRPEIVHRVNSILGNDVLCWRTEFFPKYPGDEGTDWHQALTFANASGTPQILWPDQHQTGIGGTITVWTAFTESNIDNGCLQFIPETHKTMFYDESKDMNYDPNLINSYEKNGLKRGFFGYDYQQLKIDENWHPDESKAFQLEMKAGEFVIFWSTLLHASYPHSAKTNDMRLGYAARYVPPEVKIYPDTEFVIEYGGNISLENYGAVLVSGKDKYQINKTLTSNRQGHQFNVLQNI